MINFFLLSILIICLRAYIFFLSFDFLTFLFSIFNRFFRSRQTLTVAADLTVSRTMIIHINIAAFFLFTLIICLVILFLFLFQCFIIGLFICINITFFNMVLNIMTYIAFKIFILSFLILINVLSLFLNITITCRVLNSCITINIFVIIFIVTILSTSDVINFISITFCFIDIINNA